MDDPLAKHSAKPPSQEDLDSGGDGTIPPISEENKVPFSPPSPRPQSSRAAFSPGDKIAGRFQILRFIAHGGMGEVYEAQDLELKQKVALKTVRFLIADQAKAIERFRQEIVVARSITHPNVCRTFDLFRHSSAGSADADILVVSMELLRGETLEHWLRAKGPLSTAEAFPLVKQMIAGLHAAHEARVVHRDFKTSNVMLVASGSASNSFRAVITDFGLAHSMQEDGYSLTGSADMIGTPAYMAPEQVEAKKITPATDIYSLGIVMFQMVTGSLPFQADTPMATAIKRLQAPAPSPKTLQPFLDEKWTATILKCLEREPENRFSSVQDVELALAGQIVPAPVLDSTRIQFNRNWKAWALRTGVGVVAGLAVFSGARYLTPTQARSRPSVAVVGFKNLSSEDVTTDPLGGKFVASLGSLLDVPDQIRYIRPEQLSQFWQPPGQTDMPADLPLATLKKLHEIGCEYVVTGTYAVGRGAPGKRPVQWNIHIVKTENGETLGTIPKTLTEAEFIEVMPSAGAEVRTRLGVSLGSREEREVNSSLSTNDEATKAFAAGQQQLLKFDYSAAKDSFQTAVDADPRNPDMRSALAETWWALGWEDKAKVEASKALELASDLPKQKILLIQARADNYSQRWDDAAKIYEQLWQHEPKSPYYGLLLAGSQAEGNHPDAALNTLTTLQKVDTSFPEGIRAQRDLQLADVNELLGNNQDRLNAASAAVNRAWAIGALPLQARAEIKKCLAMQDIGTLQEAEKTCQDAVEHNKDNPKGTAQSVNAQANLYLRRRELDRAEKLYREAVDLSQKIGDKRDEAGALLNLGVVQHKKNNLAAAVEWYRKSIEVSVQRAGINDDLLLAKEHLAAAQGSLGEVSEAIRVLQEVAKDAGAVGNKDHQAIALNNLCDQLRAAGRVQEAEAACQQSLALRLQTQNKSDIARSHIFFGELLLAKADFAGAEGHYKQALQLQQEIGESSDATDTKQALADLYVEKGDFAGAIAAAEETRKLYEAAKDPVDEAAALVTLAEANFGLGHAAEAKRFAEQARKLAAKSGDESFHTDILVQTARVIPSSGTSRPLASILDSAEKDQRRKGQLEAALTTKLARAELLKTPADRAARTSQLQQLAAEAGQHGFTLLQQKALKAAAG